MTCALKETFDATANYSSAFVVRRRRRLLRVFQMGSRRGLGIVGTVVLIAVVLYLAEHCVDIVRIDLKS
jgi:flagellin-like protein